MKMLMRIFRSWLVIAILVLVMVMLTVEPARRKPLLARTVATTCRLLTWAADSAAGAFDAAGTIVEEWLASPRPSPNGQATSSDS